MTKQVGSVGVDGAPVLGPGRASMETKTMTKDNEAIEGQAMEKRHSEVQQLARQYTRESNSATDTGPTEPIFGSDDPNSPLNPLSEKFNARSWAQNIANVAKEQGQRARNLGVFFENMNVFGYGTPTDFQKDVGNIWLALPGMVRRLLNHKAGQTRIDILRGFDGVLRPGEMLAVLGPPGSGCSTFLKTISGETNGIYVNEGSYFNYQGLSSHEMHTYHRGDAIYTAEVDVHFPMLTVGETLTFAARARCQRSLPENINRHK